MFFFLFQRIAGADSTLQQTFTDALGSTTPYTEMKVKEAINTLNNKRKERLTLLLEYIEDQGMFPCHPFTTKVETAGVSKAKSGKRESQIPHCRILQPHKQYGIQMKPFFSVF